MAIALTALLVTFAPARCGALAAAAVVAAGSWRRAVPLVLLAVAVPVVGPLLPVGAGEGRPVTVALVQGNVPGVGMGCPGSTPTYCISCPSGPTYLVLLSL